MIKMFLCFSTPSPLLFWLLLNRIMSVRHSGVIGKEFVEKMKVTKQNAYGGIYVSLDVFCSVYWAIIVHNLLSSGILLLDIRKFYLMLLPRLINAGLSMVIILSVCFLTFLNPILYFYCTHLLYRLLICTFSSVFTRCCYTYYF